jgi:hypothetical protein
LTSCSERIRETTRDPRAQPAVLRGRRRRCSHGPRGNPQARSPASGACEAARSPNGPLSWPNTCSIRMRGNPCETPNSFRMTVLRGVGQSFAHEGASGLHAHRHVRTESRCYPDRCAASLRPVPSTKEARETRAWRSTEFILSTPVATRGPSASEGSLAGTLLHRRLQPTDRKAMKSRSTGLFRPEVTSSSSCAWNRIFASTEAKNPTFWSPL